jgi:phenylalanyl-tRNA synthetase alpha chain
MSSESGKDYIEQVTAVREAFDEEIGRFANFYGGAAFLLFLQEGSVPISEIKFADPEGGLRELANLRVRHTGKKSRLSDLKKIIGRAPAESRAAFGRSIVELDTHIDPMLLRADHALGEAVKAARIESELLDVTLPGTRPRRGHLHPITLVRQRLEDIFVAMGYAVEDGPEIETDFYNFTALNIPESHPARSVQDTFYTSDGFALRSQTSTVQIHAMQRRRPPLRVIAPGRVFRRDTPDATHNPMFFQLEGLLVDRGVTMAHLKGTVAEFLRRMFGAETRTRFRPSYFPFTEPSAEFDFTCFKCNGSGTLGVDVCRLCKGGGWIELGGSGMVHPNVLRAVDIDPEEFSGFAFGFGIDRMCALLYNLDDIRLLFENDVRFLEQFN